MPVLIQYIFPSKAHNNWKQMTNDCLCSLASCHRVENLRRVTCAFVSQPSVVTAGSQTTTVGSAVKRRCWIENAFARLEYWRGIATRYIRCADLFLSAICLGATFLFWLPK